jgi:DNA repair protein RecO (recombination protein O)
MVRCEAPLLRHLEKSAPDQLLDCYVLHRRDHGNTSLLLELFCRPLGRFPALAKGAKGPRSLGASLLQPFSPLLIAVSGRGEVKTLRKVEPAGRPRLLTGKALYCGFYVNELIMRMLGRLDPHEHLYDHYGAALAGLATERDVARVLRRFEMRLLEQTGYAMVLERDAEHGQPLRAGSRYRYDPERGPLECLPGEPGFSVSGHTLMALAEDGDLDTQSAREAKELMRRVLSRHLGDRPLKSRELFRQLFSK